MKHIFMLFFVLACSNFVFAEPAEIEFTATVKSIQKESDQVAILMLELTSSFDVAVRVTGLSEIQDEEDKPMSVSEIKVGMTLEIEGLLTQKGVLAQEVEVTDKATDFELQGKIENLDVANREIKVHGFIIHVPATAEIKDEDGNPVLFTELRLLQLAEVEGHVSGNTLIASEVKVKLPSGKIPRINFEGIVVAKEGSTLRVLIEGVDAAFVQITPETDIHGDLAVGVLVRVAGTINPDLSIRAHKIIVKNLLQVAPHELEMGPNKTRHVEVILRGTLETEAKLNIVSSDPSVAKPSVSSLTIPAGKVTAFFEVTSGATDGKATIEVQIVSPPGGHKTSLKVEVGDEHDDHGDKPKELEVEWRPEKLTVHTGESKRLQLRLSTPAPAAMTAEISLHEGSPDLLEFPNKVEFAAGSREAVVEVKTKNKTGKAVLRAKLSGAGGDSDDLKVEIR